MGKDTVTSRVEWGLSELPAQVPLPEEPGHPPPTPTAALCALMSVPGESVLAAHSRQGRPLHIDVGTEPPALQSTQAAGAASTGLGTPA